MFSPAIAFPAIASIAAALGFGRVAETALVAAELMFVAPVVAVLASLALGLAGRPS
jgi:uncharacterized membrane protein YtjA (UPF0391 family)